MTSRVPLVWLVFLAVLLSGCNTAEDLVNRRLPPVPEEQQRAAAVQMAEAAIAGLNDVNAGFNLRIEDIESAVRVSGVAERLGLGQLKLRGDRQLILADAEVAKTFSKDDFPDFDANTKDRIEALKPQIRGNITVGLGLTTTNTLADGGRLVIGIRLVPLFRNMEVDRVALAGQLDIDLVVTLMNRLADKLSGELGRTEIAKVSLPVVPFKAADLSRALALTNAGSGDEKITITARPLASPVYLRGVASFIDDDDVTFIAELAPVGTAPTLASADPATGDYVQLKAGVAGKLLQGLGIAGPRQGNWVAVSKQLVAQLVNAAFQQGQPCFKLDASLADRTFDNEVTIPDDTTIDCTPSIDCRVTKDCSTAGVCDQAEDCSPTRDCQVCALGACFNDPTCERERTVASHNCEVRKALRVIACQRLGAPQRAACEREKAAGQASCEAGKSATKLACEAGGKDLKKLAGAGNLARLSGTVRGSASISICMKEFSVAPSLERVEASVIMAGEGSVDLGIKYVPQEIAGYLDCRFPWAEGKHMKIELREQPGKLNTPSVLETSTSSPTLRANIKTSALAARMRPSPRELLLDSYSMRATCTPRGAMLHDVTLDLTRSVPEIGGDFSLPGDERTLLLSLEPMALQIAGTNAFDKAAYVPNAKTLILSSDLSAVPAN